MSKISADKLQTELAKGTTAPVYLLTGEDVYRKGLVIEQLRTILHPDDFNFFKAQATSADVSEALAQANTAPVFSDVRLIVLTGIDKLPSRPGGLRAKPACYYHARAYAQRCQKIKDRQSPGRRMRRGRARGEF